MGLWLRGDFSGEFAAIAGQYGYSRLRVASLLLLASLERRGRAGVARWSGRCGRPGWRRAHLHVGDQLAGTEARQLGRPGRRFAGAALGADLAAS